MKSERRSKGFTLIELIIFIVILAALSTVLASVFTNTLKGSPRAAAVAKVAELAQERMELILAKRGQVSFSSFTSSVFDPCTSVPASTQGPCAGVPSGYTVTSSLQTNWNGDTNYKVVTVTVTSTGTYNLQYLVASY